MDAHVYCGRVFDTMTPSKVQVRRLLRKLSRRWHRPLDGPAAALLPRARLWFHSVDLGNGVVTPGSKSLDVLHAEAEAVFGPLDLRGKSVLDIGAWNGYFSFEAKRRQAERVLATDHFCWTPEINGRVTFDLARTALNLEIEDLEIDVPTSLPIESDSSMSCSFLASSIIWWIRSKRSRRLPR